MRSVSAVSLTKQLGDVAEAAILAEELGDGRRSSSLRFVAPSNDQAARIRWAATYAEW
jgi:hypothetical protein